MIHARASHRRTVAATEHLSLQELYTDTRLLSLETCACQGFAQTQNCCHQTHVLVTASHRHTVAVTGHLCLQGLHTDTCLLSLQSCACKGFTQTYGGCQWTLVHAQLCLLANCSLPELCMQDRHVHHSRPRVHFKLSVNLASRLSRQLRALLYLSCNVSRLAES